MNGKETDKIIAAGIMIEKLIIERENILKKQESGPASVSNSKAQGNC